MARGFIKNVGGQKRMRFVKAGSDANNMATPPNQVIFDSEDVGVVSILAAGEWYGPPGGSGPGGTVFRIANWSDPGFVPLCMFQLRVTTNSSPRDQWTTAVPGGLASESYHFIRVDRTGIDVRHTFGSDPNATLGIRWFAYRMPVI